MGAPGTTTFIRLGGILLFIGLSRILFFQFYGAGRLIGSSDISYPRVTNNNNNNATTPIKRGRTTRRVVAPKKDDLKDYQVLGWERGVSRSVTDFIDLAPGWKERRRRSQQQQQQQQQPQQQQQQQKPILTPRVAGKGKKEKVPSCCC